MASFNLVTIAIAICLASFANAVAITGPQGGVNNVTGQRPFRQDISTFKNSGPAFDLYILSLQKFQQQNQSALLSYYQVAGDVPLLVFDVWLLTRDQGIHGRPYIAWDGVQGAFQTGFCTHSSILFPSWHRPYVALFEVRFILCPRLQFSNTYRIANHLEQCPADRSNLFTIPARPVPSCGRHPQDPILGLGSQHYNARSCQ